MGIWAQPAFADIAADKAAEHQGSFGFVVGRVVKAACIRNKLYLNFSNDWRRDFTVTILAHDLHLFKRAEINPLKYEGKTVRVRG